MATRRGMIEPLPLGRRHREPSGGFGADGYLIPISRIAELSAK